MLQPSQDAGQPMLRTTNGTERDLGQSAVSNDSNFTLANLSSAHQSLVRNPDAPRKMADSDRSLPAPSPVNDPMVSPVSRRRSLSQRTIRDMTVHGVRHSFLTLVSTALGGGLLAVAFVMQQVGVGLGILMLAIGAMLAYLSTVALMRISTEIGECSFAGLFSYCAGQRAGPIIDTMQFVYGNGCCVNFFCFLSDFIPELVTVLAPQAPGWCSSRWLAITASAVVLLPMELQKELATLRHLTPISILALLYVAGVIAARCFHYYSEHARTADRDEYGELKIIDFNVNTFSAFAICVFAYNCHMNVVPVAGHLVRPTKARIQKVAVWVNMLQLAFYILIGSSGYLTFLAKTPGDILKGFKDDDPFIAVGRGLLTFSMMVAMVMTMNPTVRCGLQIRDYFYPENPYVQPSPQNSPRSSPEASPQGSPAMSSRALGEAPPRSPGASGLPMANEPALPRLILTVVCMVVQALIAIVVPNVADVISLLGATVATAMMMVIPAYAIGKVLPFSISNRCQQAVLLFFAVVSVTSVPIKILQMANLIAA